MRYIQEILGHQHSKTTEIYTHVSAKSIGKIKSPLDNLNLKQGGDVWEGDKKEDSLATRGGISEPVRLYHQFWNNIRSSSIPPFLGVYPNCFGCERDEIADYGGDDECKSTVCVVCRIRV